MTPPVTAALGRCALRGEAPFYGPRDLACRGTAKCPVVPPVPGRCSDRSKRRASPAGPGGPGGARPLRTLRGFNARGGAARRQQRAAMKPTTTFARRRRVPRSGPSGRSPHRLGRWGAAARARRGAAVGSRCWLGARRGDRPVGCSASGWPRQHRPASGFKRGTPRCGGRAVHGPVRRGAGGRGGQGCAQNETQRLNVSRGGAPAGSRGAVAAVDGATSGRGTLAEGRAAARRRCGDRGEQRAVRGCASSDWLRAAATRRPVRDHCAAISSWWGI
jgi:hypothetical protein